MAPERLETADGLQERERLSLVVLRGLSRLGAPSTAGLATRSIRSTMSASSMRPPASRKERASSRSIVLSSSPQNSAQRSLTSW